MTFATRYTALSALLVLCASMVSANPLEPGWTLNSEMSNLRFQSIKNTTKVESSSFATFTGGIGSDGSAEVVVALDSVDTKIDIRNVRMRFLFFETFNFPEARISARIETELLDQLAAQRRVTTQLPFSLDLHGVKKTFVAEIVATLLTDDLVSVASATPVSLPVAELGLMENLEKLQEAAGGVVIVPSATVTFDFVFNRDGGAAAPAIASATTPAPAPDTAQTSITRQADVTTTPVSLALETQGDFGLEECIGRFETMTVARGVFFRTGSAALDAKSEGLLDTVVDIVRRCPDLTIEVGGHTDADGSAAANQRLSERRAATVADFLERAGIEARRVVAVGYGEEAPIASNETREGKSRNRRIEFKVVR